MPRYLDEHNMHILRTARRDYACEARPRSLTCLVTIRAGTEYVEYVGEVPAYATGTRECVCCAREWPALANKTALLRV